MASTFDVAKYITERTGEVSAMKLQKLMFYAQAWNLVWEEAPLLDEDFQAWANGPVLPSLYQKHRGMFKVDATLFPTADSARLSQEERGNIDRVLAFYGDKTAQWLSNLTHQEDPWKKARGDTPVGDPSTTVISQGAMHEYYSSL
ncbi:Panacea domain-containing protein [Roseateles chitinivorans]|uniref:Panacea domain-containing protein n=1 Tax=Roseateles chitinivorans TaxID=2917965 RepID=UPI003D66CD33